MGNACIWWEPIGSDTVRAIDLGAPLADLQVLPVREERHARTAGGRRGSVRLHGYRRVTITSAPFTSYTTLHEVEAMVERVRAGGRISVAEDTDEVYAAYAEPWTGTGLFAGIDVAPSPWQNYGATVGEGDRIEVRGPSPRMLTEATQIVTTGFVGGGGVMTGGGSLTVSPGRRHDWSDEAWLLVRNVRFWPALLCPLESRDAQMIIHKHRRFFVLEMQLEEDVDALTQLAGSPSVILNGTTDSGGLSLSAAVEAARGEG